MIEPDKLVVLNKGQRSVKGLASGFEDVATLDLIITMREDDGEVPTTLHPVDRETVAAKIQELANVSPATPSHLYIERGFAKAGSSTSWTYATSPQP